MNSLKNVSRATLTLSLAAALLAFGCRAKTLEPVTEASSEPAAAQVAAERAAIDAEKEVLATRQSELEQRQAELVSLADRLDQQQTQLARRSTELTRRERDVDRRLGEIDARLAALDRPTPAPAPDPPKPTPAPAVVERSEPQPPSAFRLTVPAGTKLAVELIDPLSSRDSQPGDSFRTVVAADVVVDGEVAIAAGSRVRGEVIEVVPAKRVGGQPRLDIAFTDLEPLGGRSTAIEASFSLAGRAEGKRDAATIGGAAAGGAVVGRVLSDNKKTRGTIIGSILGAAAGAAIAGRDNKDIDLTSGTPIELKLERAVHIVRHNES